MTKLHQLQHRYGQSPWLDNLTRGDLVGGRLRRLVAQALQARADSSWQVPEATRQPGARSGTGRDAPASRRTRS